MLKNTANQKWIVFAFDATTGLAQTGDAAQITANLRKDYGDAAAITDTNPTELEDGFYAFDLSQAETNADHLLLCPQSSTSNIVVIACPAVIFTEPAGRKYPASLAAADVSGNVPVDVAAIQSGLATATNVSDSQTAIINAIPTVEEVQNGLATPTNITSASGVSLSSAGIKAIWDFLTADVTTVIDSFANLFKTNIDAKVSEAGGGLDAEGIRNAIGLSEANLDDQLGLISSQIAALGTGTGPTEKSYYVGVNGTPCGDVLVIMSLDSLRAYPIHKGTTDATGWVKFYPNVPSGTKVYMWSFKTGVDFVNPDEEEI